MPKETDAKGLKMIRMTVLFLAACAASSLPAQQSQPSANPTSIDFSYAGFEGGGVPLPRVPAVLAIAPSGADDSSRLEAAIEQVESRSLDANGYRGALLLGPGEFHVAGQLVIHRGGVVLRGSGSGAQRTTIVAEGIGRRTLIQVGSLDERTLGKNIAVGPEAVAAGALRLPIENADALHPGDLVEVRRKSTEPWIEAHAMTGLAGNFADARLDWKPGSHDLVWDRRITSVDRSKHLVTLDAPLTFEIDPRTGPGTVSVIETGQAIRHVGIENLTLVSAFDNSRPKDEEHAWMAIGLDNVEDAWVRDITARHFVSSAVFAGHHARRVTIQDCRSEAPVSEEGGYRRQSFLVYGQQVLVFGCSSEYGMNDFATGLLAAGPNVFLQCEAKASLGPSGSFEGLASGVLYEQVHVPGSRIQLLLDESRAQAGGWTAANSLIWNSEAQSLDALGPYDGEDFVRHTTAPLYEAELRERGLQMPGSAAAYAANEAAPAFTGAPLSPQPEKPQSSFQIVNGRFTVNGKAVYGGTHSEAWWHGNTSPEVSGAQTGWSLSRFMPGQVAPGLTEDLPSLVNRVLERGAIAYQSIPGLWYDRRRDEHSITRRQDGNVWAPFFEMPWARSGTGVAWDGLSRFDLSRYNPWYFAREKEFADLAGERGLVVIDNVYNTHNVLEIGPHWIDYPWRPSNNINDTGLPEPPPFEGRPAVSMSAIKPQVTRMNVGNEFYSTAYPPLRKLHHDYIVHTLDELGELPNVIFSLAYQYAGPLEFQQFFLDTVAEWEKQHGRRVRIALVTSKAWTDAILADPVRSRDIAMVDMRYWYYLSDGSLWAPDAGQNRSYRDLVNTRFGGNYTNSGPSTTPELAYRQVREYRDRYPKVAFFAMENGAGPLPILMGGAASPSSQGTVPDKADANLSTDSIVDAFVRDHLASDLQRMNPVDGYAADAQHVWMLASDDQAVVLIYSPRGSAIELTHSLKASQYRALWLDPATGQTHTDDGPVDGHTRSIAKPNAQGWLLLLRSAAAGGQAQ